VDGRLRPSGKNIVQAGLMREVTPVGVASAGYKFSSVGKYMFAGKVTLFLCQQGVELIDGGEKKCSAFFTRDGIMCGIAIIRVASQFRNQRTGFVLP
jgi:hypothetical protein